MSKFVLNCESVSQVGETLTNIGSQMSDMEGIISGYNVSEATEFNFHSALKAIASNVKDSSEKINNTQKLLSTVVETHTNLQNSLVYSPNSTPSSSTNKDGAADSNTTETVETKESVYTVKSGDNLTKIAKSAGVTLDSLLAANTIENDNLIYPGDKINIPEDSFSSTSTPSIKENTEEKIKSNEIPISSSNISGKQVSAKFTAYYPADNELEGGFQDALGNYLDPEKNTCAAPKEIPFGTKIQINGTGTNLDGKVYTVTDRGGAINKESDGTYHFDILMSSNSECNDWGIKHGSATIIDS